MFLNESLADPLIPGEKLKKKLHLKKQNCQSRGQTFSKTLDVKKVSSGPN
jgi:hypothetical protein